MRTMFRATLAALVLAVCLCLLDDLAAFDKGGAPAPAQADQGSFTLAVLRRDGVIVPFVSSNRVAWGNPWNKPGPRQDVPLTLAGLPDSWWLFSKPRLDWRGILMNGARQPLVVKQPAAIRVHCQHQLGLLTDYQAEDVPPQQMQPYPKDGLAATGDIEIAPIQVLAPTGREATILAKVLAPDVLALENKILDRSGAPPHPSTPYFRAATPVQIEALYRTWDARLDTFLYYVEAIKRYPSVTVMNPRFVPRPGRPCDLISYVTGWIADAPIANNWVMKSAGGLGAPDIEVTLVDCSRAGLLYTLPLGTATVDGQKYWFVQRSGWNFERYDVVRWASEKATIVFKSPGGECAG